MAPQHGDDDGHFHPRDALSSAVQSAALTGGAGLFIAAIQNAMTKQKLGAWTVFTRGGSTIGIFAASGGAYEFTKQAAANLREADDYANDAIGGFFGGAVLGLPTLRMPRVLGYGTMFAVVMGFFEYTGGSLRARKTDPSIDEFERKEQLRLNRRRPIDETLAEIGEGRGIRPPGYEERRRQRLKEKYGIEVKTESADPNANC
ncbi:hypothetical protein V8F33_012590 [Rhypophila sp. PSN 637]|uniref:Uncharacterized protein n=1 Tax=Rhypophila decipiens TaxID=261697 RepID=A0AAN6YFW3_9PEZI|nr:hypothetical protein QBC37DRAFT_412392 [Rhypophila decipiens]